MEAEYFIFVQTSPWLTAIIVLYFDEHRCSEECAHFAKMCTFSDSWNIPKMCTFSENHIASNCRLHPGGWRTPNYECTALLFQKYFIKSYSLQPKWFWYYFWKICSKMCTFSKKCAHFSGNHDYFEHDFQNIPIMSRHCKSNVFPIHIQMQSAMHLHFAVRHLTWNYRQPNNSLFSKMCIFLA